MEKKWRLAWHGVRRSGSLGRHCSRSTMSFYHYSNKCVLISFEYGGAERKARNKNWEIEDLDNRVLSEQGISQGKKHTQHFKSTLYTPTQNMKMKIVLCETNCRKQKSPRYEYQLGFTLFFYPNPFRSNGRGTRVCIFPGKIHNAIS